MPLLGDGGDRGDFAERKPADDGPVHPVRKPATAAEAALAAEQPGAIRDEWKGLVDEQDALRRSADERIAALEALDQIKEDFIVTASHDLKSPLTAIRGYAQLLLRQVRVPAPDLELIARGLAVVESQSAAMVRLLDDLLDASRIQMGALELRTAPCDLGECLDAVLARLGSQERARVEIALPDAPLAGEWEQSRIEQLLANLIGNALKYSLDSEPIGVAVERHLGEIEVAVADRGIGIPPSELPRVFERFYRTPQALASSLPGSGMGLYICWGIVAAHGGRLWAESPGEGQGATFRFTLPDRPPKPDSPAHLQGRRFDGYRGT